MPCCVAQHLAATPALMPHVIVSLRVVHYEYYAHPLPTTRIVVVIYIELLLLFYEGCMCSSGRLILLSVFRKQFLSLCTLFAAVSMQVTLYYCW